MPGAGRYAAALAGITLLVGVEAIRLHRGGCSVGLRRQTPRDLGRRHPLGVLAWGLDTGIPVTTIRATMLPFVGLLLVLLGFGGTWIGVAYAVGFLVPLWVLCFLPGPSHAPQSSDVEWMSGALLRLAPRARASALGMSCVGACLVGWLALVS